MVDVMITLLFLCYCCDVALLLWSGSIPH